ncbi:rod shape-determining protein MreC [Tepidibacter formicigenes]|uniref:Cell shape-determining protein MreC n=1 Tax=Tepidibacter formicigenes DSM 15518 TaxID=1123349 RepID=A0A1M6K1J7_9FIRM|nr:rod shape-determining protein MreC [Tepidibacter formicigenes]SHJ52742.1 rod shape-determining protein MreC [Tepidibacter formicigenes DSM 15518]
MRSKRKKKNNLNKEVIVVVLITITLLVIIGISIKGNINNYIPNTVLDFISPIQRGINKIFTITSENVSGIINYRSNLKKIEELSKENEELKKKIIDIDLKRDELGSLGKLKKSLNYISEDYDKNYVSASVVSKNDGNWYTTFTISAGKKDGVIKDSIVICGEGLVGKVYEVSDNYSKAISLLNNKSAVSFEVLRKGEYTGVISQNISIDSSENFGGYLKGYLFDIKYEVVPGDIIITSGIGIYPKGIPLGEVEKVIEDKNNLLKYIKVKPYVNFKKVDKVLIIRPRIIE